MKSHIAGKVRNLEFARDRALLPLFEAVINSIQAIDEARNNGMPSGRIEISVERTPSLTPDHVGDVDGFVIEDDGIGLDKDNFKSFCTSDSVHKLPVGGKGLGRFSWLKVFLGVDIESTYIDAGQWKSRNFKFDFDNDPENSSEIPPLNKSLLTKVRMRGLRGEFRDTMPNDEQDIAFELIEHCAPMLLRNDCPSILLIDKIKININEYFLTLLLESAVASKVEVYGEDFEVVAFKSTSGNHRVNLVAHGRSVQTRRLNKYIPNLPSKLGTNPTYAINCYVHGNLLDQRVDPTRCKFNLPTSEMQAKQLFSEPTLDDILKAVSDELSQMFREDMEVVRQENRSRVLRFVEEDRPEYHVLIKNLSEVAEQIPYGAPDAKVDEILAQMAATARVERRQSTESLLHRLDENESLIAERVDQIMRTINEEERANLAQHVAGRKVLIDLLGKSMGRQTNSNKYHLEEVIHNLIFPMRSTSGEAKQEQNHLWIIDERLSYHTFLTSDRSMKNTVELESDSLKRCDLLVYNTPWAYVEDDDMPYGSFTIVEFKRPMRDDYNDNENPLTEVFSQIDDLRAGKVKRQDGRVVELSQGQVPVFVYIIADITPKMKIWCLNANLNETPDKKGYFGYHNDPRNAYIEVIGYQKLLNDAKKRNRILFQKLGIG